MSSTVRADVVILGGGVAGLWLLNRLRRAGYQALLVERDALGAGQTRYAQGIIHGGTKYALTGQITGSSESIAAMPERWRACLEGRGELDLRSVRTLSAHQYLWSTRGLTSRMAGFFASRLMRSRVAALAQDEYPEVFRNPGFQGQVYRLEEPVLDVASLVSALAAPHRDATLQSGDLGLDPDTPTKLRVGDLHIEAQRLVLAAGEANGELLARLGRREPQMQLRPLQMVMLRGEALPGGVFAHCLGASTVPRMTISSHRDGDGRTVWYIGGQPAEEGVGRSREAQIRAVSEELQALMPWMDFARCQWATLHVDRAEVRLADGSRPDGPFACEDEGVITAWPTKLAFAPLLSDSILDMIDGGELASAGVSRWDHDHVPGLAALPWQEEERWS